MDKEYQTARRGLRSQQKAAKKVKKIIFRKTESFPKQSLLVWVYYGYGNDSNNSSSIKAFGVIIWAGGFS